MNLPPLTGAAILTIAIVLQLIAGRLHVDAAEWIASLGAFGVVVMWGQSHAATAAKLTESRAELEQLHKSLMPPREPSSHTLPPMPPDSEIPKP